MYDVLSNNQVVVAGEVNSDFTFSHEVFGEKFYIFELKVPRFSGNEDYIPVMVSERLIDVTQDFVGEYLKVEGQYRSYNCHTEKKNRLMLSVFAREVSLVENYENSAESNMIILDGFLCKEPVYRKTPMGREIADLLVAVNRPYGKSDYIPCICWGRNAKFAGSTLHTGENVKVTGRIQSREYTKPVGDGEVERRVAYEVSVNRIEVGEDY